MHFLVMVKVNEDGPSQGPTAKMGAFNDSLERDGMLFAAEGLQHSSKGTRISFAGAKPVVTDGPFAETKEVVGGFWILQGSSKEEIVERLRSMERAGLSQVFINPPMDGYNDCIDEISRDVIARM